MRLFCFISLTLTFKIIYGQWYFPPQADGRVGSCHTCLPLEDLLKPRPPQADAAFLFYITDFNFQNYIWPIVLSALGGWESRQLTYLLKPCPPQGDAAFCFIPIPLNVHTTMPNDTFRLSRMGDQVTAPSMSVTGKFIEVLLFIRSGFLFIATG